MLKSTQGLAIESVFFGHCSEIPVVLSWGFYSIVGFLRQTSEMRALYGKTTIFPVKTKKFAECLISAFRRVDSQVTMVHGTIIVCRERL